jgi:CubicO group peptidase (beta-lactamase class C family)
MAIKVPARTAPPVCVVAIAIALSTALGCAAAAHARSSIPADRIALFDRYLEALRREAGIPGLSAAILQSGDVVWERPLGYADVQRRIPARPDTPFPIASLTKTFTSTLLLRCVEQRTLDLDEPIRRYSSLIPEAAATVRHVLSHTSRGTPGSRFEYDGDRFLALTPVVESCTASAYRVALNQLVLAPLAMRRSVPGHDLLDADAESAQMFDAATLAQFRRTLSDLAVPYDVVGRTPHVTTYPPRGINASAGLVSTVQDLAQYDRAIDRHLIISAESQQLAWSQSPTASGPAPYGLGWFIQVYNGRKIVWHFGQWPQFSALYLKVPDNGLTLVLLANSGDLSSRFPLARGDVTVSPFARVFLTAVLEGR